VKRHDTLSALSRRYGVPVAKIAERNNLARSSHIYVGQRLIIPVPPPKPAAPPASAPAPAASVQQAINGAPVKAGRWRHIVVHHSGVDTGTMQGMDRYHREDRRMENGLAYHFVIGNGSGMRDGEIGVARRWREQLAGGHLASAAQNEVSIGICLVGNFDKNKPTAAQMRSLDTLTRALMTRCKLTVSSVKVHHEINVVGTRCPGKNFPAKTFRAGLQSRR
jgi:LysM repeat protein